MIRYKTTLDKTLLSSSFTIPAFTIIKPIRIIMKSSTICSIRSILICTKIISCCKNFVYSGYNSLTLIISCAYAHDKPAADTYAHSRGYKSHSSYTIILRYYDISFVANTNQFVIYSICIYKYLHFLLKSAFY